VSTPADAVARRRAELLARGGQSMGASAPSQDVASRRAQLLAAGGTSIGAQAPDEATAVARLALQGAAKRYSDEGQGWLESTFPRLALTPGDFFDPSVPTPAPMSYQQARDAARGNIEAAREALPPGVGTGIEIAADIGTDVATGLGAIGKSAKGAAALGALSGLGGSTADLTRGDVGGAVADTALGAGFGAAGQKLGDVVAEGAGKVSAPVREYLLRKAGAGKAAAAELAGAQAAELVGKNVQQARSAAGSAASRARNTLENIEGIDVSPERAQRTVGEARAMLYEQLDAVDDALEAAIAKAKSMGVDPESVSPGRQGAFLSPGSKLDKAQKAAQQVRNLRAAREEIVAGTRDLRGRMDDELLPDAAAGLREAQAELLADPRLVDLEQNVLKNAISDFPEVAAEARVKRGAFREALASQADDEAALAQRLLSGEEAMSQAKQRLQRYAAPLAGSLAGGLVGTAVGIGVGNDPADAALFGLAGAGARPALRSIQNLAKQPSIQNKAWGGIEYLAKAAPESFGKWAGAVTSALARGPAALQALDKVLRDTSPEWRQLRQQQDQQAARQANQ